jgi:pimeloyl-ACP methyl ester carboxylesterase
MSEGVVLLHGLARTSWSMAPLARRLRRAGYATLSLDYPSRRHDLATIAESLADDVDAFAERCGGPVHFVTHSMGGLVVRTLLARRCPKQLGHVVMLGPPNQGSELADLFARVPLYRRLLGPAAAQLVTRRDAGLADLLGPADFSVGVIAGTRSLYPLASLLLPRPNDGRVSVAATRLDGMADHLSLPLPHMTMMLSRRVAGATLRFLRTQKFNEGSISGVV